MGSEHGSMIPKNCVFKMSADFCQITLTEIQEHEIKTNLCLQSSKITSSSSEKRKSAKKVGG